MKSLSLEDINAIRKKSMNDLYFFAKAILGFDWLSPKIHIPLCRLLENYTKNKKLRIILPRGWLKTTLCSQAYPIWRAIRNPNVRILLAQNTFTNAVAKLRVIRAAFEDNELVKLIFPELLPKRGNIWKGDSLCITRPTTFNESTFEAAGIRTQVTSRHYDVIIEDDTVAPDLNELGEENICPTKEDIDQAIGWHRLVPPLLVNPTNSQVIVVGTRWFEKDLLSWIGENEKSYVSYIKACIENGEVVYPERFSAEVLDDLKGTIGPYLFSCLYMNEPVLIQDMVFRPEWMKYYDTRPGYLGSFMNYTTIDPAGDPEHNVGKKQDSNVVITTGKDIIRGEIYVHEYFRKQCNPGEVINALFDHVRKYHPVKVAVEAGAYQGTLQYWIKERMRKENLHFYVETVSGVARNKYARIQGLQPLVMEGKILFRRYMTELVNELITFPNGAHDDIIDALSMQLSMWAVTRTRAEEKNEGKGELDALIDDIRSRFVKDAVLPMDILASNAA